MHGEVGVAATALPRERGCVRDAILVLNRARSVPDRIASVSVSAQPVNLGATTMGQASVVGSLVIVTAPFPVWVAVNETFVVPVATNDEPPPPPPPAPPAPPPAP